MDKGALNDSHTLLILMELCYSKRILFKMNCNRFFLVDASIPLPFILLRSGFGFTPTERGDSDLPELSNTIGQKAFCQGDSAHGASRYWERVGGIFNSIAL